MAKPIAVVADGQLMVRWCSALLSVSAPTVAELNAGVDLSCYFTADGFDLGGEQATITDDRLCDTEVYSAPGRLTRSLNLTYVFNILSAPNDQARLTLTKNALGYFVMRWGMPFDQAIAAGQKVDVLPVRMGIQRKQRPEANSVLKIQQGTFPVSGMSEDVSVAA